MFVSLLIQIYILDRYHMHLFNTGVKKSETDINQHLYLPGLRRYVCKEVSNCNVCQVTKWSDKNMTKYQLSYLKKKLE